jgi:glycosyltransferase involved in cell wall biosynthesis
MTVPEGPATAPEDGRGLRLAFLVGTISGGTARHVGALADGCRRAGAAVTVLGPEPARAGFDPAIPFVPVRIGDKPRPASDTGAVLGLRRELRRLQPDVVHAHGVRAGAFAALAIPARGRPTRFGEPERGPVVLSDGPPKRGPARLSAAPGRPALLVTIHNAPPEGGLNRVVYGALERLCARRADAVLCASDDLVARMRRLGAADATRFDIPAPPAGPPSADAVARAAADIGADGRPVILAVGRLARQKGFDVLIAAASRWRDTANPPRTVIAGAGPLARQLGEQARHAGADVVLLGARADVPALLAVADVFVLPSRWEARALVLQEAMRAGRAIVATKSGGTPALTGAEAAVLVPPEDDAALAEAVLAVLDDPALAAALGLAARARAGSLPTEPDAIRQAMTIYHELAVSRSTEPPAPGPQFD